MEASVSHSPSVVHLVPRLSPDAAPPSELLFQRRMGPGGRTAVACAFGMATVICAWLLVILWTSETPGWWFNAIFTLMLIGLPAALWVGYAVSLRDADRERAAQRHWSVMRATARPIGATVLSRQVGLSEDGGVSSFTLTVAVGEPHGGQFDAEWKTLANRDLLQSQVPGVGAPARVWVPGETDAGYRAFVVEVADPTVTLHDVG